MKILRRRFAARRRGFALLTVLALAGFLMLLAGAIGSEVVMTQSATKSRLSDSRARYAAYTGLQYAMYLIRTNQPLPVFGPNDAGDAANILLPGNESVSFTLQVVDNRGVGTDASSPPSSITAPDGTVVPGGAVYCASVGIDNGEKGVALHAVSGMMADQHPTLEYAAFADQSTELLGNSQSRSFVPAPGAASDGFGVEGGRPTPLNLGNKGDLGTNRGIKVDVDTVGLAGDIRRPASEAASTSDIAVAFSAYSTNDNEPSLMADPTNETPELLDLPNPVDIPRYTAPKAEYSQAYGEAPVTSGSVAAAANGTTKLGGISVPPQGTLTMALGRYYVDGNMVIDGNLASLGDENNPVVIFVKGDASISGKVNLNGQSAGLQVFFVDTGAEAQTFTVTGEADFFGTVVGNRVDGVFQGESQMFGGFLGRSFTATDNAGVYYDESLGAGQLAVAANWGLHGVTEPKPEVVTGAFPKMGAKIALIKSGTPDYRRIEYQQLLPLDDRVMEAP